MTGLQCRIEKPGNVGDLASRMGHFSMASKEESHLMLIMVSVIEWTYIPHVCSVGVSFSRTRVRLLFVASLIISGTAEAGKIDFSPHNPCFDIPFLFRASRRNPT